MLRAALKTQGTGRGFRCLLDELAIAGGWGTRPIAGVRLAGTSTPSAQGQIQSR